MSDLQPLVSVCIPVYNGAKYIAETIQSVLAQTYSNIEILVQDNASTDETGNVLREIAAKNSRIDIERNEINCGMAANWNLVINRARGDYIMLLSADDLLMRNFIEACLGEFDRTHADAVTTNHLYLEANATRKRNVKINKGVYKYFVKTVLLHNPFSINFTLFPRKTLDDLRVNQRVFSRSLYTCDYDFWLRAALSGVSVSYLAVPLAHYRVHVSNLSKQLVRMNKHTFLVLTAIKQLRKTHSTLYKFTILRILIRHLVIATRGNTMNSRLLACQWREIIR